MLAILRTFWVDLSPWAGDCLEIEGPTSPYAIGNGKPLRS